MGEDIRYLNFPIQLIHGAFNDITSSCNDIIAYCVYNRANGLKTQPNLQDFNNSGKYYNIPFILNEEMLQRGATLFNSIPQRSPKAGIKVEMILEYLTTPKTPHEVACLLAYVALRSILGLHPYKKIQNKQLVSRMSGYCSNNELRDDNEETHISNYITEWRLRSIKDSLKMKWGVKIYGCHMRGFYVSTAMELDSLIIIALKSKKKYHEKVYREKEEEALKRALRVVYGKKDKPQSNLNL